MEPVLQGRTGEISAGKEFSKLLTYISVCVCMYVYICICMHAYVYVNSIRTKLFIHTYAA